MNKASASSVLNSLSHLKTIRFQAQRLLDLAKENQLEHFSLNLKQMDATALYVIEVIKERYPTLDIPYHSRWRHFEVCGLQHLKNLEQSASSLSLGERSKILTELVILSVFLDAGAGASWKYIDPENSQQYTRSEGLALASLVLYQQGLFSNNPAQPLRVDAQKLISLTPADLLKGFQITSENPLQGLKGRVALLNSLGKLMLQKGLYFGPSARLGEFYSYLNSLSQNRSLSAKSIFQAVLKAFQDMWPIRLKFQEQSLGDVGIHSALKTQILGSEYVPFHKLSQWLTYSLLEPLERSSIEIQDIDELTGLPEYRNGGLLVDTGLLVVKDKQLLNKAQDPHSEAIVEWRALTIALLDELTLVIRKKLQTPELALAKVLQGGTWEAGRRIAQTKRPLGIPPIQIISDGTLF